MGDPSATPSFRQNELLEAAYRYVLQHGISRTSLRPLAAAIGSSTRVLMFLFGSKDGLIRALLDRARMSPSLLPNKNMSTRVLDPIAAASGRRDVLEMPCCSTYR